MVIKFLNNTGRKREGVFLRYRRKPALKVRRGEVLVVHYGLETREVGVGTGAGQGEHLQEERMKIG